MLSAEIQKGSRVRLVSMPDDPDPIPSGTEGTVVLGNPVHPGPGSENNFTQVMVKWDNGRSLSCVVPPDHLELLTGV